MNLEKNPTTGVVVDVIGPTVEFLVSPSDESSDFCVLKGIVPAGVFVPMHRHADTESFVVLSGTIECLKVAEEWTRMDLWQSGRLLPRAQQCTSCLAQCFLRTHYHAHHNHQKVGTLL